MNYIRQLNAFYRRRQMYPMTSAVADLYLLILQYANISGWKKQVSLPNTTLMSVMQINKTELFRRRGKLIEEGLITYKNGCRGKAGLYEIKPLYDERGVDFLTYESTDSPPDAITDCSTLYKQKEKTNDNKKAVAASAGISDENLPTEIMRSWQSAGFKKMSKATRDKIFSYLEDGMENTCVMYAIAQADENDARSFAYVQSILRRLKDEGILTAAAIKKQSAGKLPDPHTAKRAERADKNDYFNKFGAWDDV